MQSENIQMRPEQTYSIEDARKLSRRIILNAVKDYCIHDTERSEIDQWCESDTFEFICDIADLDSQWIRGIFKRISLVSDMNRKDIYNNIKLMMKQMDN